MLARARPLCLALALVACGTSSDPALPFEPPPSAPPQTAPPPGLTTVAVDPDPDPEPEPDPDPEPGAGLGTTDDPRVDAEHPCTNSGDCVLVSGMCGAIVAAHRDGAAAVRARFETIAGISECGHMATPTPVDPSCEDHVCTTTPAREADARTCTGDDDCEALAMTCHWLVASRTATEGYARLSALALASRSGPQPPCVTPPAPALACRYGYCSRVSDLVPEDAH